MLGSAANLAATSRSQGLGASAKADFDRMLQLQPKNAGVLVTRGNLYLQQHKWQEASADFNDAIAVRQDIAPAFLGRGRASLESGQLDNALKDFDQAIAININVPAGFFWRGQAWRRKGDLDRALDDLSRAVVFAYYEILHLGIKLAHGSGEDVSRLGLFGYQPVNALHVP